MDPGTAKFVEVVVMIVVLVAVPIAGYAAIAATRAIWLKAEPGTPGDAAEIEEELEQLRARVAELEGVPQRMMELEERVDFSERLLTSHRDSARLPGGQA